MSDGWRQAQKHAQAVQVREEQLHEAVADYRREKTERKRSEREVERLSTLALAALAVARALGGEVGMRGSEVDVHVRAINRTLKTGLSLDFLQAS